MSSEPSNPVETYIQQKYGELLGIYEDAAITNPDMEPVRSARNEMYY